MSIQACNSIDGLEINADGCILLSFTECGEAQELEACWDSEWNGNHLVLGTYHIWVDATGDLRIKNGAPTSGTDGTVVGAQTA